MIIHWDCLEEMKKMKDNSIDLILTDIPYWEVNETNKKWWIRNLDKWNADIVNFNLEELVNEFIRISKWWIYIFCGMMQFSEIMKIYRKNKITWRCIVWEKNNPSPIWCKFNYVSWIELCAFWRKAKTTFNSGYKNTVFKYPVSKKIWHTTPKNLQLFEELINLSSNEWDTILDPFAWSWTTWVACKNTNRNYILIEKEKEYIDIINERLEAKN